MSLRPAVNHPIRLCDRIQVIWNRYGNRILFVAAVLLATAAAFRLLNEFWRLAFWDPQMKGANDLRNFQNAMKGLFTGQPIYRELNTSPYPPASYAIFWPFLGWLDFAKARLLWTFTIILVLIWLSILVVRHSKASTKLECTVAALLLLSMNGTGVTIGNGQLGLHVLAALLNALLILDKKSSLREQVFAALLFLFAVGKPTISAPFVWIVLFASYGIRVLVITGTGYLALTAIAVLHQHERVLSVFQSWFTRASLVALEGGYGNLYSLLHAFYLDAWMAPASLLLFALLGCWFYFHRNVDLWIAMGVTAIVARFWTYHRYYDDVLIILPMICLFRIAKSYGAGNATGIIAGFLLAVLAFLNLARLHNISLLRFHLITTAMVTSWLLTVSFLLYIAAKQKKRILPPLIKEGYPENPTVI